MENNDPIIVVSGAPTNNLEASRYVNDYMAHPKRWTTTPRLGFKDQLAVRHQELKIGRSMTVAEQDAYLLEVQK